MAERLEDRRLMAGDAVLEWNDVLLDAVRADRTAPPLAARNMAMVQCAVYDAVNAIVGGFEGYVVHTRAPKRTAAPAAVARAAHDVLADLYPAQRATFGAKLAESLAGVRSAKRRAAGEALGRDCAASILSARGGDGSRDTIPYTGGTGAGDWRPTPPAFSPDPVLPQWPLVTPFAVPAGDAFRPAGPPPLDSAAYAQAYDEVKALGAVNSPTRTAEQTQVAQFWADGAGTATPPGHWNEIAQDVARARRNTLARNARLFAVLDIALADAGVCAWDAKYDADLWRPVTGIRSGDADGNAATAADPSWAPLLVTPPFPSYVSGHSTFSAAAATVLADFYGTDRVRFTTVGEDTVPGVTRSFKSFSSAAAEAGQSRIYGGIHWQFDNQDGLAMGRSVGRYVVDRVLQRKRRGRGDAPEKVKAEPAPAEWRGATEAGAFLFSTTAIADAVLGGQE